MKPAISVLMPCFNPGSFLKEAVASVLAQPECLELLVADGGSTDGSLELLHDLASSEVRIRIIHGPDQGPADALNKAFAQARGTMTAWLNADDLLPSGALCRAAQALLANPSWLMVYGEGEEFNASTGLRQRYPTLQPEVGLSGFRSHCFICQPSVVFRRTLGVLLGPFDLSWRTAFDFDYWLRAFAAFPERIGYIPYLQGLTRLHASTITSRQRFQVALEATVLLARHFGPGSAMRLRCYARELQLGIAQLPVNTDLASHLADLFHQASPYLNSESREQLRKEWLLDPAALPALLAAEQLAAQRHWHRSLPVQLLLALQPQLQLHTLGPMAGPHRSLETAVQEQAAVFPLLESLQAAAQISTMPGLIPSFAERPFGVNLIGHAFDVFGIGEDIRMAARALEAADVPFCVIDHPAANGSARSDSSLAPFLHPNTDGGPYAFNLVCMAAPIHARWLLQNGLDGLRERYTITAWPWETQEWPDPWRVLLLVADECWPSSRFTCEALKPYACSEHPVHLMPMAAEITQPERFTAPAMRGDARRLHGLPSDAVIFAYGFDLNSTAARKNPMAALEAFQQAFPCSGDASVALMIKTFTPCNHTKAAFECLRRRAIDDPRIHLVVCSLDRDELLALYGCCDVFLSLHRSEGFGRGIAEALQLGLDVIATDFGGNTDFCIGPLSHPVRYQTVPIPSNAYPYADGHFWAEPDLAHAISLIRQVAQQRWSVLASQQPVSTRHTYQQVLSATQAGLRYRTRLEELWRRRDLIGSTLRWRAGSSPIPDV
jgi:glycosyltransferase involved in cell wall biosynthesis